MNRFLNMFLVAVAVLAFSSCGPGELEYTYERYYDNIFTVNKHAVSPEFQDTSFMISNMDAYGFQTGDRVHMTVREYYDASTMKRPVYEIVDVTRKIETFPLSQAGSVDTTEYNAAFYKLEYYEFADRYVNPEWIWKNRQNIHFSYFGLKDGADFAMSVIGVNDDCVEFDLRAKATRNGQEVNSKLLTFDLSNIADFLTAEQKNSIAGKDSLRTRIYLNREEKGALKRVSIIGGKFANPVK